jgi:transcriptional regulator with XRE-family HTH domain
MVLAIAGVSSMLLHKRLREIRRQRGMKLENVAKITRMSASYLSAIEQGKRNPPYTTLLILAAAYEMTIADLLTGVDEQRTTPLGSLAPGLAALVRKGQIDEAIARDLNRIELGGKQPQTEEAWLGLYLYLKQVIQLQAEFTEPGPDQPTLFELFSDSELE